MIHQGDCLTILRTQFADESVQCCVTSPPYWGLRDYGCEGQLGLEATPELYVAKMVEVFREVKRVLKDDGTLWLNLGSSYWSDPAKGGSGTPTGRNGRGEGYARGQRATAYDISDKAPGDFQVHGCLCENLCGVCRVVYQSTTHTDALLVSMLTASLSSPTHGHRESLSDHLPTSGSSVQENRTASSTRRQSNTVARESERLSVLLLSMIGGSSPQLLDECLQRANHGECLLCGHSLTGCAPVSEDRKVCTCDTEKRLGASVDGMLDTASSGLAYPHSTTTSFKAKDMVPIPWMVAMALQADGWYLRSDIIWAKPNPMPESVTDRPTKAHEYLFLLSKSEQYYYNAEAIKEPGSRLSTPDMNGSTLSGGAYGRHVLDEAIPKKERRTDKQRGHSRRHAGFNDRWDAMEKAEQCSGMRNKRTVWTVATQPYSEAHFATFPPKLIEPCILAGCPSGGLVLDPFAGSGTTIQVAQQLGRQGVGIELNPAYIALADTRTAQTGLQL